MFSDDLCWPSHCRKDIQFLVDAHKRAPKHVVLALIGPGSMAGELKQFHGPEHRLQL